MRVLLLESPFTYGAADSLVGSYFALGIGYLAAYLREHGHEVAIFQPPAGAGFDEALIGRVQEFSPDVVGISVMTPSYPRAVGLCDLIRRHSPCHTVLGGHHISAVGAEVLQQSPHTDFAVFGEGEQTLLELVDALAAGRSDFSEIAGLLWRAADGHVVRNAPRAMIADLDSLPLPARDLVDMGRFRVHSYIDFGKKSATMITSRGCPYKCIFCSSWLTMGSRYRFRSVESCLAEIRELVQRYGVDHIVFEDDTMTLRRDRMLGLCRGLADMPGRPSWYCLSRVDTMDGEVAAAMKQAGCRMVNFGIESGSPEVLAKIGKKISLDKAVAAVAACRKAGLRTQCTFIVGFPFDTDETLRMTLDAAKRINPTIAIFFPLMPYPGTKVFEEMMDPALIPRSVADWSRFVMTAEKSPVSLHPRYSSEEVQAIANRWHRKFYLRPGHMIQMLRTVSSPTELWQLAQGGLYLASRIFRRG